MVAILSGLLSAGCSVFGIRTEQSPAYTVERTIGPVELRHYGPRLAADVTVSGEEIDARSKGFRRLAAFIFGANTDKTSIDMTAPVAQAKIDMTAPVAQTRTAAGDWRIRFFMPAKFTRETLPRPDDKSIEIVTVPAETVAVLRYSGSIAAAAVHEHEQRLMQAVSRAGLHAGGAPFTWFYDPPWTLPPLRRNEAAILIDTENLGSAGR